MLRKVSRKSQAGGWAKQVRKDDDMEEETENVELAQNCQEHIQLTFEEVGGGEFSL